MSNKIVDGVELLRMIRDGEIKNRTKIKDTDNENIFEYNEDIESFLTIDEDEDSIMHYYTDKEFAQSKFEILSEEDEEIDIQAIEELQGLKLTNNNIAVDIAVINRDKINKLIKAVKQLDKKIK